MRSLPTAVLGGSFNPPHIGHLALARAVLELGLAGKVLLIPAASPPHKATPREADAATRLEMTRLLALEDNRLAVDGLELSRPGPSFTVDTVRSLLAASPAESFRLLIGSDQAKAFATWRDFRDLLRLAPPLIAERPDALFSGLPDGAADFPGMTPQERSVMTEGRFAMPPVPVSSTMVRELLAAGGADAERHVTPRVLAFIRERGLYGTR